MEKKNHQDKVVKIGRRGFIGGGLAAGVGCFLGGNMLPAPSEAIPVGRHVMRKKVRPVLVGDWWLIGRAPTEHLQPQGGKKIEPVDHHLFKGSDGHWHLWGCVRNTEVGRVLYHWQAADLTDSPWRATGDTLRCNEQYGECIDDWVYYGGREWMQSPYFVQDFHGKYYMFYGGHSTGKDVYGNPVSGANESEDVVRRAQCQICLMTSDDGLRWTRHRDKDGYSRVFVGPGEARDPCVINVDGVWHMYYSGEEHSKIGGVYLRTSTDLINWSAYKAVHYDPTFGETTWHHECPHVVYRQGYFYLFRTASYTNASTHVYRSRDPADFGISAASAQPLYVGEIACAATEIYHVDGDEYVSSNHNPPLGTQMCRLSWEPV